MAGEVQAMWQKSGVPSSIPSTTVQLSVKCKNLLHLDTFSRSDPMCVMSIFQSNKWYEIGRTEHLKDTADPEWAQKFQMQYNFEAKQVIKFEVYDSDSSKSNLDKHDFLGRVETTMANVVSSPCKQFVSMLKDGPKNEGSKIYIDVEEVSGNNDLVQIQLSAVKLDKKDTFGKSDPFYIISKGMPSGQFIIVHRSEVIKNNLNPNWRPLNVLMRDLCSNDHERTLKIDVYDEDMDGGHDLIGSCRTDLTTLKLSASQGTKYPLINPKKEAKKKKKYVDSGNLIVKCCEIIKQHSFLDYIQGGTRMNFSVAIDFTASNGDPSLSSSLHFRNPPLGENQYTQAIRAVGSIIEDYDVDKQFPALGFGAKIPPHNEVSHEFFLNIGSTEPFCQGVSGILEAYDKAQRSVTQYGPTFFAPIINHVAKFASAYQDGKQYFVLLILTDGIITDFEETKTSLISASKLPMSVIIIGVGNEDFSAMNQLDADNGLLKSKGQTALRDIVQFVEMRKFINYRDGSYNQDLLAQHVLAEVPKQMVSWMTTRGIKPLKF
jgi:hypothetical protein